MPYIDSATGEVVIRVVYGGVPGGGKSANLERLGEMVSAQRRGAIVTGSADGAAEFDWLDFAGGYVDGRRVRCQLLALVGPTRIDERALLLKSADVFVFVVDSRASETSRARILYSETVELLRTLGQAPELAVIVQANKQDEPGALSPQLVAAALGVRDASLVLPAVASTGSGVMETVILAARIATERVRALSIDALGELPSDESDPSRLQAKIEGMREAERKTKEEAERKVQEAKEEAERKAREAKEEAERKVKQEAERKARDEAERKARAEAERKAQEAKEQGERKAQEAKEEAERKAKQEAERKARDEAERKARAEAERKAKQAQEETARRVRAEAERQAKEAQEVAERKARAEAEHQAKEAQEAAERKARAEAERQAKEESQRPSKREEPSARPLASSGPEPRTAIPAGRSSEPRLRPPMKPAQRSQPPAASPTAPDRSAPTGSSSQARTNKDRAPKEREDDLHNEPTMPGWMPPAGALELQGGPAGSPAAQADDVGKSGAAEQTAAASEQAAPAGEGEPLVAGGRAFEFTSDVAAETSLLAPAAGARAGFWSWLANFLAKLFRAGSASRLV
ncbi:MAG TPA: ADP-ribosylation factor-like protein [Polyangiaceae bacterium]|nr:ADP-ribosylation factor-like protein [Polyangiaceae bacterium]